MIVVDSGAFVELLLRSPGGLVVDRALEGEIVATPAHFDAEVLHRLLAVEKRGVVTQQEGAALVQQLRDAPFDRLPLRGLLVTARRYGVALSGYDALYVAAAALLDATLVTTDGRLARTATEQFGVAVTTVPTAGR